MPLASPQPTQKRRVGEQCRIQTPTQTDKRELATKPAHPKLHGLEHLQPTEEPSRTKPSSVRCAAVAFSRSSAVCHGQGWGTGDRDTGKLGPHGACLLHGLQRAL